MRGDHYCRRTGCGWPHASAGNADAPASAASSDEYSRGKTGISTDGKSAGKCEGRADHARASAEDRQGIKSYPAAGRGGDSRRQGKAAAVGPLSEVIGGLYRG